MFLSSTPASGSGSQPTSTELSIAASITHQVDIFLGLPKIELASDEEANEWAPVAKFFTDAEKSGHIPLICKLAKKHLAAPPSSVYSERLFSEMGQVYEKKRSRLRPELAENLLFLRHNMIRFEEYEAEEEAAVKAVSHKQKVEHGRFDKLAVIIDRQKRERESDQFMNEDEYQGIYDTESETENK